MLISHKSSIFVEILLLIIFIHMKKLLLLSSAMMLFAFTAMAQKTVTGVVLDASGVPLPGASVVEQGTSNGVSTDFDGNYSIEVAEGSILEISFIGYQTFESTIGESDSLNVSLEEDNQLEEVVITALGVKRESRSIGYSIKTVTGDNLEQKTEGDIGRVLQGQVAGVNITNSTGISGSGTNIVIRGYTSITGSNQPLFIVDGVPFDSSTNSQEAFFDGNTASSRFLDLDPNSIESINVLKGLSATTLYGQQGRNGVILVTTKSGSRKISAKGFETTVSQSYFQSTPNLPDYQTEYGGGFHQEFGFYYSNGGPNFDARISQPSQFGSFYRETLGNTVYVQHPISKINDASLVSDPDIAALANQNYAYKNYDSVKNFFRTGIVHTTSVNMKKTTESGFMNLSFGRTSDEGFTPGNKLGRTNISIGGSEKLENGITFGGTMNFAQTNYKTPPVSAGTGSGVVGSGASIFGHVMFTPKSVDLMNLPYQTSDGRSIYYRSGNDIQNPRWTVDNSKVSQFVNRVYGNVNLSYEIIDDLNVSYVYGFDVYTEQNTNGQNKGGVDGDVTGSYQTIDVVNQVYDHNVKLSYSKAINDKIGFQGIIGATGRRNVYSQNQVNSTQQLAFGVMKHFNFVNQAGSSFDSEQNIYGVFADFTFDYNNYLFLNLQGRNDQASNLEKENNSLFYPGGSIAFVATDAFPQIKSDLLSYAKFRIGYGNSAGFGSTYRTRSTLGLSSRDFLDRGGNVIPSNFVSNTLGNSELKPEKVSEFEIGLDMRLLNNKLGLNISLFDRNTQNLITSRTLPAASGYTNMTINAGKVSVQGVELDFNYRPIKTADFKWQIDGNFYADESLVEELQGSTTEFTYTNIISGRPQNFAIVGQPLGVIKATTIERNASGEPLIDADGFYVESTEQSIVGDPNPDWVSNLSNTFSYKDFSLGFTLQYRHGGDLFSQTAATLVGRGVLNPGTNREGVYVLDGVNESDGAVNTTQITAINYGFDVFSFGPGEIQIFDGTTIRLSEVNLNYNVPKSFLEKTAIGSLNIRLTGSNLFYRAVNMPEVVNFDTNMMSTGVGNAQGIGFITGPSARRVGITVKATF